MGWQVPPTLTIASRGAAPAYQLARSSTLGPSRGVWAPAGMRWVVTVVPQKSCTVYEPSAPFPMWVRSGSRMLNRWPLALDQAQVVLAEVSQSH